MAQVIWRQDQRAQTGASRFTGKPQSREGGLPQLSLENATIRTLKLKLDSLKFWEGHVPTGVYTILPEVMVERSGGKPPS
jgi:hypothetical protein